MGARPEPVPQVVQTPVSSVSARLGEIHELWQAIKKIRWERQLQVAQGKQVAAEPSLDCDSRGPGEASGGRAIAWHGLKITDLRESEMDVKRQAASCKCVSRLLRSLSDSYLRLSQAYTDDGQFRNAIRAVGLACMTRYCYLEVIPRYVWEWSEPNMMLRELKDLRDHKAAEFDWRMRRLPPPPKEAFLPKGLFESLAWILAGDAYLEAQRTFDDSHVAIPHQEGEELKMVPEMQDEVTRGVRSCGCVNIGEYKTLSEMFYMPRIVENKWERNLSAAIECYSNALPVLPSWRIIHPPPNITSTTEGEDSEDEGSGVTKIAYRKLGFAWYEWGRRLAELGWQAKDETDKCFRKTIDAFHKGTDLPNFELALCSHIEYHRKLAEFRKTHQGPEGRTKSIEEARGKYEEALDLCSEAKNRLQEWGDGLHCKGVDTEEAHTYFNLGILLMEEDKIYHDKQEKPIRKGRFSADEALQEAINSYSKLDCKPEVALSQYQLGRVLRDRLLFEYVKSDVHRVRGEIQKITDSWQKAEEHYRAVGDTDMFRRILMVHSELYSAVPLETGTNKMLDQALKQMLRGCAEEFNGSSVSEEFIQKLLQLLNTMCKAAEEKKKEEDEKKKEIEKKKSRRKKKNSIPMVAENLPRDIASSSSPSMADDYKFLAEMYRCALYKDYRLLYLKWTAQQLNILKVA